MVFVFSFFSWSLGSKARAEEEEVRHYRDEDARLVAKKGSDKEEVDSASEVVQQFWKDEDEKESASDAIKHPFWQDETEKESASDAVKHFLKEEWPRMKEEDKKFKEMLAEEVASEYEKEKNFQMDELARLTELKKEYAESSKCKKELKKADEGPRRALHPHEREWKKLKVEVVSSDEEKLDELARTRRDIAETEMAIAVAVKAEAVDGDSSDDAAQ